MPAYQVGAFIGEALHSIAVQTHTTWEVIVVDDHAPDDGTRAIVEAFARERTQQVRYLRHERNQGVSAARNTAMELHVGNSLPSWIRTTCGRRGIWNGPWGVSHRIQRPMFALDRSSISATAHPVHTAKRNRSHGGRWSTSHIPWRSTISFNLRPRWCDVQR
ncbi:MAG: glycosyltransferase family 2 protein [Flavobacteriales bacterium]|nr:glycosyltransferase family 2 protein [Flavobacteriales bacterium]